MMNFIKLLTAILLVAGLVYFGAFLLPPAIDWNNAFRPAALALLHNESPYQTEGFMYPPWTSLLLLPLAIFPPEMGRVLLFIAYLFGIVYSAQKLGANRISTFLILFSPPVFHGLLNGNIDGLVVLGFVLPPWLGLFFLVIKPQIGFAYILYLFVTIFRKEKFRGVIRVFAPVTIAYLLSLALYGLWPLKFSVTMRLSHNASLWPLSLPIGLVLITFAFRRNEFRYSIMASPFLSPYVLLHSWIGALLALAPNPYEAAAAVIGMWIVVALRYFA
jgi:hypothetical protein